MFRGVWSSDIFPVLPRNRPSFQVINAKEQTHMEHILRILQYHLTWPYLTCLTDADAESQKHSQKEGKFGCSMF